MQSLSIDFDFARKKYACNPLPSCLSYLTNTGAPINLQMFIVILPAYLMQPPKVVQSIQFKSKGANSHSGTWIVDGPWIAKNVKNASVSSTLQIKMC